MIQHDKIRMKAPYLCAGRILSKHKGKPYTINLGAGLTVTISTGDFVAFNARMPQDWLEENPTLWEPYP